jgi:cellulose synthase/poly-beta-1,6-N-acetylglucosamine synthase-like glycosyltransferase
VAIERIAVVIPAHNEAELIGQCLASVGQAVANLSGAARETHVVVVADSCRDRTASRAQAALGALGSPATVLEVGFQSVGRARAAGVATVLNYWAACDPASVWLANTDADTTVPADWLSRQLWAHGLGFAAVAGIVRVHSFVGQPRDTARRFRALYKLPRHGPHPHVHGCNMGVRADAYLDVGGWPPLDLAEDHNLWKALRARGWPCLSDRWLEVMTSGRRVSRVRGGFADTLAALPVTA